MYTNMAGHACRVITPIEKQEETPALAFAESKMEIRGSIVVGLSERLIGVPIKESGPSKTLPAQFRGRLNFPVNRLAAHNRPVKAGTCKMRHNIKSGVFIIIKGCDWSKGNLFDNV